MNGITKKQIKVTVGKLPFIIESKEKEKYVKRRLMVELSSGFKAT